MRFKKDNPVLAPEVRNIVRSSKSDNTNKQYDYNFGKIFDWFYFYKFSALPADACIVVLYISFLVQKNVSVTVLNSIPISSVYHGNMILILSKIQVNFFLLFLRLKVQGEFLSKSVKKKKLLQLKE